MSTTTQPTATPADSPPRRRSILFPVLVVACLVLLILFVDSAVRLGIQGIRVSFSCEQIEYFRLSLTSAREGQITREEALDAIINYYPTGTKQAPGSTTDRIVESVREICVSELRRGN